MHEEIPPPRREAEWKRLELTGNRPAIKRADYWADKQSGSDSNSWDKDQLVQGSTTGTTKSYPPHAGLTTYQKRTELHGERQDQYTADADTKKSAFNKEKWLPLVYLPFKISHYCCNVMKKSPLGIYQRQTGRYPIVGTMTEESRVRKQAWLRHGCNSFDSKKKLSAPLSFWTEQDILQYIKKFDIDICSVYGKIETLDNGQLHCTGCQRTGCVFCGFGCHLEKGDDRRFLKLKETHPQLYDYCIRGGRYENNPDYIPDLPEYDGDWLNWNPEKIFVPYKGLGLATVFDMINEIYGENFIKYK